MGPSCRLGLNHDSVEEQEALQPRARVSLEEGKRKQDRSVSSCEFQLLPSCPGRQILSPGSQAPGDSWLGDAGRGRHLPECPSSASSHSALCIGTSGPWERGPFAQGLGDTRLLPAAGAGPCGACAQHDPGALLWGRGKPRCFPGACLGVQSRHPGGTAWAGGWQPSRSAGHQHSPPRA